MGVSFLPASPPSLSWETGSRQRPTEDYLEMIKANAELKESASAVHKNYGETVTDEMVSRSTELKADLKGFQKPKWSDDALKKDKKAGQEDFVRDATAAGMLEETWMNNASAAIDELDNLLVKYPVSFRARASVSGRRA